MANNFILLMFKVMQLTSNIDRGRASGMYTSRKTVSGKYEYSKDCDYWLVKYLKTSRAFYLF